jgi:predicted membrane protein (TIGR00267 family)
MHDLRRIMGRDFDSIIRRFFINTLFDSTFMLLGIIVGSAILAEASLSIVVNTMVMSSLALGISTGVSVYEAESLEQEKRVVELEKAMLKDLRGTLVEKSRKSFILLVSLLNFFTPLVSCMVIITPFLLTAAKFLEMGTASGFSVILALATLFITGVYLGRVGKKNPWIKGLRMVGFGLIAFTIGYLLDFFF